jgi:hypothetical protein
MADMTGGKMGSAAENAGKPGDGKGINGRKRRSSFRDALHVLLVLCVWALFFYWWGLVLPTTSPAEAARALLYILSICLLAALLTVGWVRYNLGIYRRKGPRRSVTEVRETFDADALGRKIAHPGLDALRSARQVTVSVTAENGKRLSPGGT